MQTGETVHARGRALRARTEGRSTGSAQVLSTIRREILVRVKVLLTSFVAAPVPRHNG